MYLLTYIESMMNDNTFKLIIDSTNVELMPVAHLASIIESTHPIEMWAFKYTPQIGTPDELQAIFRIYWHNRLYPELVITYPGLDSLGQDEDSIDNYSIVAAMIHVDYIHLIIKSRYID